MGKNWDWELETCCGEAQVVTMVTIGVSFLATVIFWRMAILKPFKLLTTFLHELGHACAAWLTCGSVESIRVDANEGGMTTTRGGIMCCILPAGYLGSSFWGGFFMLMAAGGDASNFWTTRVAAGLIILIMLYVLVFKSENKVLRGVLVFFIVLVIGVWLLDELWDKGKYELMCFLLFFGTMNCLFAVCDIFEDLIFRKVAESDASRFAKLTHTSSRCWGVIWAALALIFFGFCVYFSIVLAGLDHSDD